MRRRPQILGPLALAAAVAVLLSSHAALSVRPIATPVPLDSFDPAQTQVGQLRYLGGLDLSSPERAFGGISGLTALADGRLLAVTDAGQWIGFTLVEEGGRLTGVSDIHLAPLLDAQGRPLGAKEQADAEALAPLADGSGIVVTFERRNQAVIYRPFDPDKPMKPAGEVTLPGLEDLPVNGGLEAFAATRDGGYVAISEEGVGPGSSYLAWRVADGRSFTFGYEPPAGYKATDMVQVDDDSLLVLNRRFSPFLGVSAALVRLPLKAIRPDVMITGELIAELEPPLTVDNMEALAVRRDPAGRVMLYIASDNNFSDRQRTILLKFLWPDAN